MIPGPPGGGGVSLRRKRWGGSSGRVPTACRGSEAGTARRPRLPMLPEAPAGEAGAGPPALPRGSRGLLSGKRSSCSRDGGFGLCWLGRRSWFCLSSSFCLRRRRRRWRGRHDHDLSCVRAKGRSRRSRKPPKAAAKKSPRLRSTAVDGGDAIGVAIFGRVKNSLALQVAAEGLEPAEKGESYTIWLAASPQKMLPLASTEVGEDGRSAPRSKSRPKCSPTSPTKPSTRSTSPAPTKRHPEGLAGEGDEGKRRRRPTPATKSSAATVTGPDRRRRRAEEQPKPAK